MRFTIAPIILAVLLGGASCALAWDCPSGQIRQQAPAGTPTTTPYYDVVEGIAFICVPSTPTTPTAVTDSNTNTNSATSAANSASNSASSASSNQSQKQGQTQTANGGSATATGGTASATAGNSSSGSGNSTSINTTDVTNIPRQTPMAYAPDTLSTSPCVKGFSGGGAGPMGSLSLGISKIDKGCDSRQTAVIFHGIGNDFAAAKILCSTDAAKRAHLTLEECQLIVSPPVPVIVQQPPAPVQPPIVIQMQQPAPALPPVVIPQQSYSSTITNIGQCPVGQWNCVYRLMDKAILGIQSGVNNKIVLTGPPSTARVIQYLHSRGIDSARVSLNFQDINSVSVETLSVEQQ